MTKKVAIIYHTYLDDAGEKVHVGGIETYIYNLLPVLREAGYDPLIVQAADESWIRTFDGCAVYAVKRGKSVKVTRRKLYDLSASLIHPINDLIIFAADHVSVRQTTHNSLSIQHGISWDLPDPENISGYFSFLRNKLKRLIEARRALRDFENCQKRVCVDYNFSNWYNAHPFANKRGKIWVVPNFASVNIRSKYVRSDSSTSIIFARRFVSYRGTKAVVAASEILLRNVPNLRITFAGEGPDERWMRRRLGNDSRVEFLTYTASQSADVHSRHDIAVVPSLGSEGTSLSVLEAMSAECAVIAAPVGGITNIILDGYNGIYASPDAVGIVDAVMRLLGDHDLFVKITKNARNTVTDAFSHEIWKQNWLTILNEIEYQHEV
jgi:glycosyltransferase involved in cell wall biosynthesis